MAMVLKRCLAFALAAGGLLAANAAPTSESSAVALKGSQTITLAADEDGYYVYYLKTTLKRSMAYTMYTTGLTPESGVSLDIYAQESSSYSVKSS